MTALNEQRFDEAYQAFIELDDYKDSQTMVKETLYYKALYLLAKKQYKESMAVFNELGDYKDSKDLLFEAFRDTARYLDLTDWSGDSYSPAKEMDYANQRFAVVDLPEDAAPQTQTFDGSTYLTDEAFYNSLISGGIQWEPLEKD